MWLQSLLWWKALVALLHHDHPAAPLRFIMSASSTETSYVLYNLLIDLIKHHFIRMAGLCSVPPTSRPSGPAPWPSWLGSPPPPGPLWSATPLHHLLWQTVSLLGGAMDGNTPLLSQSRPTTDRSACCLPCPPTTEPSSAPKLDQAPGHGFSQCHLAPIDTYGDHALACPRSGALARRAPLVERAWVRVAREAVGADGRVVPQQWIASLHLPGVSSTNRRRLDLVTYGAAPLGEALCCDATLVSALTRGGAPIPRAADNDAVAITAARQRKQRAYLELLQRGAQRLLVLATELGGRWSGECRELMRLLVERAPRCPCGATRRPQRMAATLVGDAERGPARHCGWLRLLAPPVAARRRCWPARGRCPRFGWTGCPKPAALSHARGVTAASLTARFCTEKGVRKKKVHWAHWLIMIFPIFKIYPFIVHWYNQPLSKRPVGSSSTD